MAPPNSTPELQHFVDLDRRLVEAAKSVKILTNLGWQREVIENFFASWKRGEPRLPEVQYPKIDLSASATALESVMRESDQSHPVASYTYPTAVRCSVATEMQPSRGTKRFTDLSKTLYGVRTTQLGTEQLTLLDAANDFIASTWDYAESARV